MVHRDASTPPRRLDLIAATFTPFQPDGALNLPRIEEQAEALRQQGVRGAFVCGTTGEGALLTGRERLAVARRWCEVGGADLEIIVHVGHASVAEARELAADAERHGAAGVAAIAPFYARPRDVADLVACCAEVAAGAPHTPFYYYHIPAVSHVALPMPEFLPAATAAIPNFAGLKFTDDDLAAYALCLDRARPDQRIFSGPDEMLLAAVSMGGRAAVGSTYNFAAPLYQRMFAAWARGDLDEARRAQLAATRMIAACDRYGGLPAFKALMRAFGCDCGPCRLPFPPLDAARAEALRAELERQGFFAEASDPAVIERC